MIARVRGVMAASARAGSMHHVRSSTSTSTGTALTSTTALAVACQVSPGTITSSPGPMSRASSANCMACVPLVTSAANFEPLNAAHSLAKVAPIDLAPGQLSHTPPRCTSRRYFRSRSALRASFAPARRFLVTGLPPTIASLPMERLQACAPGRCRRRA